MENLFSVKCEQTKNVVNSQLSAKSKILITGGSGVVGLHLYSALISAGVASENILLTYFSRDVSSLIKFFGHMNFVKYNQLTDFEDHSFDLIIHCATYGQPLRYTSNQLSTLELNTADQIKLLTKLKPDGFYGFISSSDIYSGCSNFPLSEHELGISDPWSERACYFEGKRAGEAIVNSAARSGINAKAFRLALGYGAGFEHNDQRVLYQFVKAALLERKIVMRDVGKAMRTYGALVDCSRMIILGLLEGRHRVYNVGGVSRCSIRELADQIAQLADVEVIPGPETPTSKVLQAAPDEVWLDITRIQEEFDLTLESLDIGLERVFKWAQQTNFYK